MVKSMAWLSMAALGAGLMLTKCADESDTVGANQGDGGTASAPLWVGSLLDAAVDGTVDGPVRVVGTLFSEDGRTFLCGIILESYPPQCGDPAVDVLTVDWSTVDASEKNGVRWSNDGVLVDGVYVDGVLTIHQVSTWTPVPLDIYVP